MGKHETHRDRTTRRPLPGYERSVDESRAARVHDVLSPRQVGILVGCLILQALFIASYVGAFHHPEPSGLKVDVVAAEQARPQITSRLNGIEGAPVEAQSVSSRATAEDDIRTGQAAAAYVYNSRGTQDTLLVSSAQGSTTSSAVELIFRQAAAEQQRTLTVDDIHPANAEDGRGLSSFYLVVGWMVGGYLMASLLGMRAGTRARNFRRALWRLVGTFAYAVASGLVGAAVVDTGYGALPGNYWALAGVGTMVVLSSALFTLGASALLGVLGVGLAIILFVVIGNPSAGGAYSAALLPEPWATVGPWLPNGAGLDAVRSVIYYDGHALSAYLLILLAWILAGLALYFAVAGRVYWGLKGDYWGPEHSVPADDAGEASETRPESRPDA